AKLAVASNVGGDTITLIDVAKMQPIATLRTADGAMMSVFAPDGKRLYVANARDASVSVVDVKAREVKREKPRGVGMAAKEWLPGGKGTMAFIPTGDWKQVWATAPAEDKVIILDLAKRARVAEVDVPGEPHGMVFSPDQKLIYVVQRKLNQLSVIDTASRKIIKSASIGKRPDMVAISPDGNHLFVVSRGEDKLLRVSASELSVTGEVAVGKEPHGVAYRP
ncbi:MAG: YncE family protein, partial [Kiloniellales bacterium]